jgi:RNA polymerase sigma-70 factor (ECF subfamily)
VSERTTFVQDTEPFRRELFAHCYRLLGSVPDAEDLVQETYLRAWRGYAGFAGRSSVRTWLYQIATNACLTALAHHSRRVLPSGLGGPEPDPGAAPVPAGPYAPEPDPITPPRPAEPGLSWLQPVPDALVSVASTDPAVIAASRQSMRLAFIASLQHLPPQQRAVLVLRDVLAFPAAQVATMLDTTTAAVKSALQRARARLRDVAPAADQLTEPTDRTVTALLDAYIAAFESADADALTTLLLHDVTLEATPIRTWFAGNATCVPFLRTHVLGRPGDWLMRPTRANGQPAAATYHRDQDGVYRPYGVEVFTITATGISRIVSFGAPELLPAFGFGPTPDTAATG